MRRYFEFMKRVLFAPAIHAILYVHSLAKWVLVYALVGSSNIAIAFVDKSLCKWVMQFAF